MKPWIEAVLSLQDLDLKIREMQTRLATIPIELKKLNDEAKAEQAKANAVKETQRGIEKKIRELEGRAAAAADEIKKMLIQSALIKKNNEYQTMLASIEAKKKEQSDIETEELGLLDQVETAKKNTAAAEKNFAISLRELRAEAAELKELAASVKQQLTETISLRDAHEKKVETGVLDAYKRLLAGKQGAPMVPIAEGNVCSYCRLKLPPQTINQAKRGDVVYCDNCSHLLYQKELN